MKQLSDFIKQTGQYITIDFINDRYVLENKELHAGKKVDFTCRGSGENLELAIENFLDNWKTYKVSEDPEDDSDLYEQYRCH